MIKTKTGCIFKNMNIRKSVKCSVCDNAYFNQKIFETCCKYKIDVLLYRGYANSSLHSITFLTKYCWKFFKFIMLHHDKLFLRVVSL